MHELLDEAIGASPPSRIDLGSVITMARQQATKRWILAAGAAAAVLAAGAIAVAFNQPAPGDHAAGPATAAQPTASATTGAPSATVPPLPTLDCAVAGATRIAEVSGRVFDVALGDPIGDAKVELHDCTGATREVFSAGDGSFAFRPGPDDPIPAGDVLVRVSKDGYQVTDLVLHSIPGKYTNIRLQLLRLNPAA